jgi:hypothetical protein
MSKSLRSIKDATEKENTIQRRLHARTGGLGYLSACDAKHIIPTKMK